MINDMTKNHGDIRTREELLDEIEQLRFRLDEAEQTLDAIRSGEVDALVVAGPHGDQIFSLTGSERTYRQIVETMNEGALTVGLDGTILFCNQRFCSMVRYPMAEIIGRNYAVFSSPAQLPRLKVFLADARSAPVQQSFLLTAADGASVPVNIAASMLVTEIDSSICLVVSDLTVLEAKAGSISELLKQQHAMEAQQADLHAVNQELRESQRAALNLVDDVEIARRKTEEANKELQREILIRRQTEVMLRESEEQFRALADSIPNLAWWANADGYITWYNQRWYDYTGTTPEQMEGWGWQSVHDPEVLPQVVERWKESIATGKLFDMVFPLRGADGIFRPFLTRVMPVLDQEDRIIRWFGTNTDISEQKRTEEALQKAHVELAGQMEERIKELREKEVLLKEVHHRVKNNLQVISSLVSMQADGSQDDTVREVLNDVTYRVRSMALVHEKLYHSESLARIDFAEYAQSLLGYLWRAHGAAAEAIRLTLDLEPVELPVDTAVPCGLILNELAGNALKHAFRGRTAGEVTVALHRAEDGRVSLSVRDNGVGLPAEFDWQQAGSLGLRLVQMLAGQLHATVEVERDGGTEFNLSFRLKTEG
jgi:PAS domain S-box-containing protein